MAGKARVHELAKELKVRAKDVLAFLESDGERAKSASSTVEAPVARRVREFFATEIQTALPVVKASSADPTPAGMALVNLAQELGVREQAVIGYLGHLGVDTQDLSIGLLQEHSERLRERFSPVTRRSVAGDGRPDERSVKRDQMADAVDAVLMPRENRQSHQARTCSIASRPSFTTATILALGVKRPSAVSPSSTDSRPLWPTEQREFAPTV